MPIKCARRLHGGLRSSHVLFSPRFLHRKRTLCSGLRPDHVIINTPRGSARSIRTTHQFTSLLIRNTSPTRASHIGRSNDAKVPALIINIARTRTVGLFTGACLTLHITCFGRLSACTRDHKLGAHTVVSNIYLSPHVNSNCGGPDFNCNKCYLPGSAGRLLTGCDRIPRGLVRTVISTGRAHGRFMTSRIVRLIEGIRGPVVNVCQLAVGSNSSGFHRSTVRSIVGRFGTGNVPMLVCRPALHRSGFRNDRIARSLTSFGAHSSTVMTGH